MKILKFSQNTVFLKISKFSQIAYFQSLINTIYLENMKIFMKYRISENTVFLEILYFLQLLFLQTTCYSVTYKFWQNTHIFFNFIIKRRGL